MNFVSKKDKKTNVMRLLEQHDINYTPYLWKELDTPDSPMPQYKTLVTVGKSGDNYVFVVSSQRSLDLKKAAAIVGEKNVHMLKQRDLEPLTGYVHGGCSPIGMKKELPTVMDQSMLAHDEIALSAGEVGKAVALNPNDVPNIIDVKFEDIQTEADE